jgi:hypothetical protein
MGKPRQKLSRPQSTDALLAHEQPDARQGPGAQLSCHRGLPHQRIRSGRRELCKELLTLNKCLD